MPLYRVSLTMQDKTLLPRDQYENTIYIQSDTIAHPTDAECLTIDTALQGLYGGAMATFISPQLSGDSHYVRFYDMADGKPRVPFYEHKWSNLGTSLGAASLPSEVACVLSLQGTPVPLPVRPQSTRGRLFIGPLSTSAVATAGAGSADSPIHSRPRSDFLANLLGAGQALATNIQALPGYRWVIFSPKWKHTSEVMSLSVDDSWDMVHSRGDRPTLRNRLAVDNDNSGWLDVASIIHA